MTYPEMAAHYKVSLEAMKWPDRRVTRSGLRKFLVKVWWLQQTHYREDWEALWLANKFAYNEAIKTWHRQIPRWCFEEDKARVAWYLNGHRLLTEDMSKAWKWAQNRG